MRSLPLQNPAHPPCPSHAPSPPSLFTCPCMINDCVCRAVDSAAAQFKKPSQRLLRRFTYSSRRLRERSRLLDDDSCWPLSRTRDELQTRLQEPPSVLRDILTNGRFQILHDILANGRLHFCDSNGGSLVSFAPLTGQSAGGCVLCTPL